jgi:hypothetical protein
MRTLLAAGLMLVVLPAFADQPAVYTGCIQKSNGSLYNVQEGTAPTQPCKSKDKQITWNMAGQPGPQGPPGPSLEPSHWASVNCDLGERVNDALAYQAEVLGINLRGTCNEEIRITRDHVILQAEDASNPPTLINNTFPIVVSGARGVTLNNLRITGSGGGNGVEIVASHVSLGACEIWNQWMGVNVSALSNVWISNSYLHDNGADGVLVGPGSALDIRDTRIERNGIGIHGSASHLEIISTTIRDSVASGVRAERGTAVRTEGGEFSGSGEHGLQLDTGSVAEINGGTFTGNSGGIAGDGNTTVKLYGGVRISDNTAVGIGLSQGGRLITRGNNVITGNGQGIGLFLSSFTSYTFEELQVFGNGVGVSCDLSVGVCVPGQISDSISGCGPRCPDQP